MGLEEYRRKRDFAKTGEPRGDEQGAREGPLRFIIQKHDASRLHYDFRLELDGVLKSWAVPKGPSLDPATKRLAMHVEDHPLEYGSFEGVIPQGEYGGGTVMLWDTGHWFPLRDARRDYGRGRLKFRLEGEKLHGVWNLVRMGGREGGDDRSWLLIKERDDDARPGDGDAITEEQAKSVATGRSMAEIARQRDRVWSSTGGEVTPAAADPSALTRARRSALPKTLEPQLARLGDAAPEGDDWLHEMKLDGYRIICRVDGGRARLLTRNGKDWTQRFREVVEAAEALPCGTAMLDGEVVVLNEHGISDFQALQNASSASPDERRLHYYIFDVVYLDGFDVRAAPLTERKELLRELLDRTDPQGVIRYSDHMRGNGPEFLVQACGMGLEGTISKRADSSYTGGRGPDWRKTKCTHRQEFVIVGYTEPKGSRTGFGALLLAVNDDDGRLVGAGRVGTGFTTETLESLHPKLERLERKTPPIADPPKGATVRDVHWVTPELVGEVAFTEWTGDGAVRHPSFQGLREDKRPDQVVREIPGVAAKRGTKADRRRKDAVSPSMKESRSKRSSTKAKHHRKKAASSARTSAADESVDIAGVRLTSPDRVLWPDQGTTKRALAEYYQAVAERMLPHLKDRPLTLVRCPSGREKDCFFQKHAGEGMPSIVPRVEVQEEKGPAEYMRISDLPSVIALVQLGVLEFHVWGSRADRLDRPDRLIFDLDPDPDLKWTEVVAAALLLRERLDDLGLRAFVKTTGGKGLHVLLPIDRRTSWDDAKSFTQAIAADFAREWPHRFTDVMSKKRREGRIFIDYLRNAFNSTAVAAYSTRARPGAPVSMPLDWDELAATVKRPDWNIATVPERIAEQPSDPWADVESVRQSVTKRMREQVGIDT